MNVSALDICLIARFGCTISNIIYKTLSDNRHYILPHFIVNLMEGNSIYYQYTGSSDSD